MYTQRRAPHFLRVTRAVAFVSGLGSCFVGCGGTLQGAADAAGEDGAIGCGPCGSLPAPETDAGGDAGFVGGGVMSDATSGTDVFTGSVEPPDAPDDAQDLDAFAGARDAPIGPAEASDQDVSAPSDAGLLDVIRGGIGPPPEDASRPDVLLGIMIAPEAGKSDTGADASLDSGGPFDLPDLPAAVG